MAEYTTRAFWEKVQKDYTDFEQSFICYSSEEFKSYMLDKAFRNYVYLMAYSFLRVSTRERPLVCLAVLDDFITENVKGDYPLFELTHIFDPPDGYSVEEIRAINREVRLDFLNYVLEKEVGNG